MRRKPQRPINRRSSTPPKEPKDRVQGWLPMALLPLLQADIAQAKMVGERRKAEHALIIWRRIMRGMDILDPVPLIVESEYAQPKPTPEPLAKVANTLTNLSEAFLKELAHGGRTGGKVL